MCGHHSNDFPFTFQTFLDIAGAMFVSLNKRGEVTLINQKGCEILGYKKADIIGKNWFTHFLPKRMQTEVRSVFRQTMVGEIKSSEYYENPIRTKNGQERIIAWHNTLIQDEKGKITGTISYGADITERKLAELASKQAGEGFKNIFNLSPDMVAICTTEGKFLKVNPSWERVLGYTQKELLDLGWAKLVHPDDVEKTNKIVEKQLKGSPVLNFVNRYKCKDGSYKTFEWQATFAKEGIVYATAKDVTGRKKAEEALRLSSLATETSMSAIFTADLKGIITYANVSAVRMWGYKRIEEMIGTNAIEYWTKSTQGKAGEMIETLLKEGYVATSGELIGKRLDGTEFIVESNSVIVKDEKGKPLAIIGSFSDITERKRAEEALRKSEALLTDTGRMAKVGGWEVDTKTLEVNWTKETYRIHQIPLGHKPSLEEAINFYHPDDRPKLEKVIKKALEHGEPYDIEIRFITAKGKHLWTHSICNPITVDGKTVKLTGTFQDITERKQAEEAIKKSEEWFHSIFHGSRDAIFISGMDAKFIDINQAASDLTGYSIKELKKMSIPDLHEMGDRKAYEKYYDRIMSGEAIISVAKIARKDGKKVETEFSNRRIEIRDMPYMHTIARDITEQKQAEEVLHKSEAKFRLISENSKDVICLHQPDSRYIYVSPSCKNILGYNPEDLIGTNPWELVHPDDLENLKKKSENVLKGESIFLTYRILKKSGEYTWFESINKIIKDDKGNIIHSVSSSRDITERKQAEEDLKRNEQFLNSILESVQDGINVLNPDLTVRHVNGIMNKWYKENIPLEGKKCYEVYHNADKPCDLCPSLRCLESGKAEWNAVPGLPGSPVEWIELFSYPIKDPNSNKVTGVVEFVRDITERKQVEDKFIKNQYYLTKAQEIGSIGTWELDIQNDILIWTDENYKIFGVPLGTEMNLELFLNCVHPDDRDYVHEKLSIGLNKEPYDIEHRILVNDKVKWVREKADINFDAEGNPIMAIGFTQDITARKQAEEQIQKELKEKEILLRELYHRTKNNMQVICSMLRLYSYKMKNKEAISIFSDLESKIHAMSLVHQKLYESKDLSRINLKDYFKDLVTLLHKSHRMFFSKITIQMDMEDINVLIDTAIPCGLVFNELLSNIVKHAFPDNKKGEIKIRLAISSKKEILIEVSDNGVGFPEDFDINNKSNFGLGILTGLIEHQLQGKIKFTSKNGLCCRITLKEEGYEERV